MGFHWWFTLPGTYNRIKVEHIQALPNQNCSSGLCVCVCMRNREGEKRKMKAFPFFTSQNKIAFCVNILQILLNDFSHAITEYHWLKQESDWKILERLEPATVAGGKNK